MNEMFLSLVLACIGSSGVSSIIVAVLNHRWSRRTQKDDRMDAVVDGVKVLTVDRVRYLGKSYISDHEISLEDKENLKEMYRAYKGLGGNGHLETIMHEIEKLPMSSKEGNYE